MDGIPVHLVGEGIDWPAWFQAIGSLVGIAIAIAVPAWQRHQARDDRKRAVTDDAEKARKLALKLARIAIERLVATHQAVVDQPIGGSLTLLIRTIEADIEVLEAFDLHSLETAKQMQAFSLIKGFLRTNYDGVIQLRASQGYLKHYEGAVAGFVAAAPHLTRGAQNMAEWI